MLLGLHEIGKVRYLMRSTHQVEKLTPGPSNSSWTFALFPSVSSEEPDSHPKFSSELEPDSSSNGDDGGDSGCVDDCDGGILKKK